MMVWRLLRLMNSLYTLYVVVRNTICIVEGSSPCRKKYTHRRWNKQRGGKSKGYITVSWFAGSWARETTSIYRGEILQQPGKPADGRLFKFDSFIDRWTPPWRLDLHCWVFAGEVLLAKHLTNKDQAPLELTQALLTGNSLSKEPYCAKCLWLK